MKRIVILGAGESGAGAAVLAKVKGFETFVSDMSAIKDKYKEQLDSHGIAWEEGHHTEECASLRDKIKNMIENGMPVKPDEKVIKEFLNEVYPKYKNNKRVDILLNNTDFGVGENKE